MESRVGLEDEVARAKAIIFRERDAVVLFA